MYVLIGALFMMLSCTEKKDVVKYTIASQTVDCSGVGRQKCMLVKKGNASDWEYFYSQIEGFNYEDGNEYVLEVEEKKIENPPADASSIRYVLVKQISKTAKTSENLPISTVSQNERYEWGGRVLSIEQETVGRGAAEGQFPVTIVQIQVSHTATNLFEPGDTIHAELSESPGVMPVIGREYVFKAKNAHPGHAKGVYMLETDVMDLV